MAQARQMQAVPRASAGRRENSSAGSVSSVHQQAEPKLPEAAGAQAFG
jgi:hypothetical protein